MPMILLGNHAHGKFQHHEVHYPQKKDDEKDGQYPNPKAPSIPLPYTTRSHIRHNPFLSLRKTWTTTLSNILSAIPSDFQLPRCHSSFHSTAGPEPRYAHSSTLVPRATAIVASPWSKSEIFVQTEIHVQDERGYIGLVGVKEDEEEELVRCESAGSGSTDSMATTSTMTSGSGTRSVIYLGVQPTSRPRRLKAKTAARFSLGRKSMVFEEVSKRGGW